MRLLRAFTLLEILVVVSIMGLMVTVGVMSVRSGRGAVQIKGATRDIFAAIRSARSIALVTQQPAVVTYSVEEEDGEPVPKIEIVSKRLMTEGVDRSKVRTLGGAPLKSVLEQSDRWEPGGEGSADGKAEAGDSLEGILFAPIDTEVVKGMRIKVAMGDEIEGSSDAHVRKSRVSAFSNVDYLIARMKGGASETKKDEKAVQETSDKAAAAADVQEPVKVRWEANGRVEPHQVWVYADGTRPEDGLLIRIDRFGAAKVLSGDGREE